MNPSTRLSLRGAGRGLPWWLAAALLLTLFAAALPEGGHRHAPVTGPYLALAQDDFDPPPERIAEFAHNLRPNRELQADGPAPEPLPILPAALAVLAALPAAAPTTTAAPAPPYSSPPPRHGASRAPPFASIAVPAA